MKFKDRRFENQTAVENLCLTLSLGAVFIQIWILTTTVQSYLAEKTDHLWAALLFSGAMLSCCALTALTTMPNFIQLLTGSKSSDCLNPEGADDSCKSK